MNLSLFTAAGKGSKRLLPAALLGLTLIVSGCSSTTSNTATYGGPSVSSVTAQRSDARREVRSAKRDMRSAEREVARLERSIERAERKLKSSRTSDAAKAELKTSIREDKRTLRTAKRDLRKVERALARAERDEQRAVKAIAAAKERQAAAERKLALEEKRKREEEKRRDQELAQSEAARPEAEKPRRLLGSRLFSLSDPALENVRDYEARIDGSFPVAAIPVEQINKNLLRQEVRYNTRHKPGTIVVDPGSKYLYLVQSGGTAMRYGIGVGKAGFEWSGEAHVGWKQEWPKWTPPEEMIERRPELAKYSAENGGMPGGPQNPLGARALYLMQGGVDTLYRLHGTPEWSSIGTAASSGCIRLMNQDIIDLYSRVRNGAKVVVL